MSTVKKINQFFKTSTRAEIDVLVAKLYLTERQAKIYTMKYINGQDIGFIADTLYVSRETVNAELKNVRDKLKRALEEKSREV